MNMALPPFIPTLKAHNTGNHTRTDNMFCSESLLHTFIKCNTDDASCQVKTDHYQIISQLTINVAKATPSPQLNFCDVDWPKFRKTLKSNLSKLPCLEAITDKVTFKHKLDDLNKALWDTINKHIDTIKPSAYSERWWSPKLTSKKSLTTKMG